MTFAMHLILFTEKWLAMLSFSDSISSLQTLNGLKLELQGGPTEVEPTYIFFAGSI